MSKLIAVLQMGEDTDSNQIKISIENELEQIAAMIKSTKGVSVEFYDEEQSNCLFASTKKGFIIYDETWGIFAQDIAELTFKTKQKVRILNLWLNGEESHLENAIKRLQEYQIPIDCAVWEEVMR